MACGDSRRVEKSIQDGYLHVRVDAAEDTQIDLDLAPCECQGEGIRWGQLNRDFVHRFCLVLGALEEREHLVEVRRSADSDLELGRFHNDHSWAAQSEESLGDMKLARERSDVCVSGGHIRRVSPSLEQRLRSDTSFERLYRQHRRDVYGAVLRDVRDPDEAEDVTQIAFLNAFRAIRRGEEPEKPRAWLVTIARNVCRRRYRDLARRPQEVGLDPEVVVAMAEVDGPTAGEIAAAIRRLPENQRAVILLREVQGRSYNEIAAELDLSLSAVETLIFRARRSLSEQLELSEHAPVTQKRRVRGWFAFPLPGFGSLSFSLGRTGVAAMIGGVAIVTAPMGASPSVTTPPRAPTAAEAVGPAVARSVDQSRSEDALGTLSLHVRQHPSATASDGTGGEATGGGGDSVALPQVAVPSVDPSAALPSVGPLEPVSVPVLPVQPALPAPPSLPPPPPPALPPLPLPLG